MKALEIKYYVHVDDANNPKEIEKSAILCQRYLMTNFFRGCVVIIMQIHLSKCFTIVMLEHIDVYRISLSARVSRLKKNTKRNSHNSRTMISREDEIIKEKLGNSSCVSSECRSETRKSFLNEIKITFEQL